MHRNAQRGARNATGRRVPATDCGPGLVCQGDRAGEGHHRSRRGHGLLGRDVQMDRCEQVGEARDEPQGTGAQVARPGGEGEDGQGKSTAEAQTGTPLRIPYGNKEAAFALGVRYPSGGWYAPPGVGLPRARGAVAPGRVAARPKDCRHGLRTDTHQPGGYIVTALMRRLRQMRAHFFTAIDTAAGSVVDPWDAVRITAGP